MDLAWRCDRSWPLIALIPTPPGLSRPAQLVLAIAAFTIVLWATEFMNNGVASVFMMGLLIVAGIRVPLVLSGFSAGSFWTLLAVLYYGFAMRKTGLAERLSYYILSLFPGSYRGVLTAFFVIGFILASGHPVDDGAHRDHGSHCVGVVPVAGSVAALHRIGSDRHHGG